MSEINVFDPERFLSWFKAAGGWYDEALLGLKPFKGMGFGAIALQDIAEDAPLFHIPDALILSAFTSDIKSKLTEAEWERLDQGWCRLILSMMYESILGEESKCALIVADNDIDIYHRTAANMPSEFDTPMLWDEEERAELAGTDIQDRIGKEGAEEEYHTYLLPVIKAHPELFPPTSSHTTLAAFHLQGSRILSRSFTVPLSRFQPTADDESEFSDDEEEQVAVMIPFADMLNAAYERDNAHLYGDEESRTEWKEGFTMKSTKSITKDAQIYNTYASPPNAELLRKYGHVDVLPLPAEMVALLRDDEVDGWPYGNPGDEAALDGSLVVEAVAEVLGAKATDKWRSSVEKRIDWWLEEGLEDTFPLTLSAELDDELVAFVRLLLYDTEWMRAKKKGKMPGTAVDGDVARAVLRAVERRKEGYKGDIKDDLQVLSSLNVGHIPRPGTSVDAAEASSDAPNPTPTPKDLRRCYATIVRLGEKRILSVATRLVEALASGSGSGSESKKRKADEGLEK